MALSMRNCVPTEPVHGHKKQHNEYDCQRESHTKLLGGSEAVPARALGLTADRRHGEMLLGWQKCIDSRSGTSQQNTFLILEKEMSCVQNGEDLWARGSRGNAQVTLQ